jgi:hypothetical protein
MHTPSLKFEEDMQFPKVIIVKQFLEKQILSELKKSLKLDCIALFGPLKQILSELKNFFTFTHL